MANEFVFFSIKIKTKKKTLKKVSYKYVNDKLKT
jgi:hypothetical protein